VKQWFKKVVVNSEKPKNILKNNILNCPLILEGMSNEMQSYMNSIVAFSFLLKENCSKNQVSEEFSNQILNSCNQFTELFDGFLDSAIIDIGNSDINIDSCNLNNIMETLLSELFEKAGRRKESKIDIITEFNIPYSAEVYIDKNKVLRVIRCLLHNSINSIISGYIKIGYFQNGDNLTFYVIDSGQNYYKCKAYINSDDINKSFVRYSETFIAINISLARKLVEIMKGKIWIERNGLAGAGIYFSIPAKIVDLSNTDFKRHIDSIIP